jgi:hypothetical protein
LPKNFHKRGYAQLVTYVFPLASDVLLLPLENIGPARRKRIFLAGNVMVLYLFTLRIVNSGTGLILMRAFQGVGGAMIMQPEWPSLPIYFP